MAGPFSSAGRSWPSRSLAKAQPLAAPHTRSLAPRSRSGASPTSALGQQKKIYAYLRRKHPRAHLPKARTIADWLRRLGLAQRRRVWARRGPRLPRPSLTIPQVPNEVWTVDFKGWFRTRNGQRVDPLTVRDLFSRFILGIRLLSWRQEPVRLYFQELFRRYGQPKVIRVDHGAPFAGDGALDLSRLSAWWLRPGIAVEFLQAVPGRRTTARTNRCIASIKPS